jgi:hypothetical protein
MKVSTRVQRCHPTTMIILRMKDFWQVQPDELLTFRALQWIG